MIEWHDRPAAEARAAELIAKRADVVLDVGPGIRPQPYTHAATHIAIEPHDEYRDRLAAEFPGIDVRAGTAGDVMPTIATRSADVVFFLDVIEHLERPAALEALAHAYRICRGQVVVFTPLGFLRQDYAAGELDGWRMHGGHWQAHRSGWTPDDFPAAHVVACAGYHTHNGRGEAMTPPHGAFWAIWQRR